jgi:hypothetical protein
MDNPETMAPGTQDEDIHQPKTKTPTASKTGVYSGVIEGLAVPVSSNTPAMLHV